MAKRQTESRVSILGQEVYVVIYGCPDCFPTYDDMISIEKSIKRGSVSGDLESNQPNKDSLIYGKWRVENLKDYQSK